MRDLQDLKDALKELNLVSNKFKHIRNKRLEELSQVDLEVSDIYHYIEIGGYNAAQASKVFKLLRQTLSRRRDIKDEFELIQALSDSLSASAKTFPLNQSQNRTILKIRIHILVELLFYKIILE